MQEIENNSRLLILVRGLPGSGKTTIAKKFASIGFRHEEADFFFQTKKGYRFKKELLQKAHTRCLANTEKALKETGRCVVANTFTMLWEMLPYINLAENLGIPVAIVEATGNYRSVHNVPESTIQKMKERWQPAPTLYYNFHTQKKGE